MSGGPYTPFFPFSRLQNCWNLFRSPFSLPYLDQRSNDIPDHIFQKTVRRDLKIKEFQRLCSPFRFSNRPGGGFGCRASTPKGAEIVRANEIFRCFFHPRKIQGLAYMPCMP